MVGLDHPDRAGLRSHDDRLRGAAAAVVLDALEQVAVGDPGGAEEDVLAGHQVLGGQNLVQVVAGIDGLLAFGVVGRRELGLDRAAHAADRRRGDDALRCAADAGEQVGARVRPARGDGARHVAVGDQPDPGAGLADVVDQLVVPGPVQDAHRDVGGRRIATLATERTFSPIGAVMSMASDRFGSDGDLVHVEHRRRVEHRAALGNREHRDRVGQALAHQRGAVDRVDGEVTFGTVAVADLLTVVEHRRVVLFALADDHDAAHRHRVHQLAHGVDRRAVAALLVAPADPAASRHGAGLRDPHEFEGEVAIRGFTTRWAHARRFSH